MMFVSKLRFEALDAGKIRAISRLHSCSEFQGTWHHQILTLPEEIVCLANHDAIEKDSSVPLFFD
jgi:hypothetical protein